MRKYAIINFNYFLIISSVLLILAIFLIVYCANTRTARLECYTNTRFEITTR